MIPRMGQIENRYTNTVSDNSSLNDIETCGKLAQYLSYLSNDAVYLLQHLDSLEC